jgi:hypothetical protein
MMSFVVCAVKIYNLIIIFLAFVHQNVITQQARINGSLRNHVRFVKLQCHYVTLLTI